jgi:MerR family transcriptional regulator, light-induced transcriptional regulator
MSKADSSGYTIGAAARLSGVSREKIRIWERRYDAVKPRRDSNNRRFYSRADIERLILIRSLVDSGHGVSSVASLSAAKLKARADAAAMAQPAAAAPAGHTLVIAGADSELLETVNRHNSGTISRAADVSSAAVALAEHSADLIVADFPTLLATDLAPLVRVRRHAPGSRMVLVYRFSYRTVLDQLAATGIETVKAPLQPRDLLPAAPTTEPTHQPEPAAARPRRFSPAQLLRLATRADQMKCECPRHLVELVSDLNAFEDYSLSCENESASDAAKHREIYETVTRARTLVEDALALAASELSHGP